MSATSTTGTTGTTGSTGTASRTARRRGTGDRSPWTCPNCLRETRAARKRCADCGTSRY